MNCEIISLWEGLYGKGAFTGAIFFDGILNGVVT